MAKFVKELPVLGKHKADEESTLSVTSTKTTYLK